MTNPDAKNAKHLFRRMLIFFLPFIVFFIFLMVTGFYSGEMVPISLVVDLQQRGVPIRFAPVWEWSEIYQYKLQSALVRQPELMILSSSRGLFFHPIVASRNPDAFYNASVPSSQTIQHAAFAHELARNNAMPDIIMLVIDITRYRADQFNDKTVPPLVSLETEMQGFTTNLAYWIYQTTVDAPEQIAYMRKVTNAHLDEWIWGKHALARGYRATGQIVRFNEKIDGPFGLDTIGGFDSTDVSSEMLDALDDILALAQENGTVIVGVLPPYNSDLFQRMLDTDGYDYLPYAVEAIQERFDQYNMPLHNFTDPQSVGGSDAEIWDHWHPGDLLSLRIFKAIAEAHPDLFAPYTDVTLLGQIIDNAHDPVNLFTTEDSRSIDPLTLTGG